MVLALFSITEFPFFESRAELTLGRCMKRNECSYPNPESLPKPRVMHKTNAARDAIVSLKTHSRKKTWQNLSSRPDEGRKKTAMWAKIPDQLDAFSSFIYCGVDPKYLRLIFPVSVLSSHENTDRRLADCVGLPSLPLPSPLIVLAFKGRAKESLRGGLGESRVTGPADLVL